MKTIVLAAALCAATSIGPAAAAHAGDAGSLAAPMRLAADPPTPQDTATDKGAVERCLKWVEQQVKVWVKDHWEVRTTTVCIAVRG